NHRAGRATPGYDPRFTGAIGKTEGSEQLRAGIDRAGNIVGEPARHDGLANSRRRPWRIDNEVVEGLDGDIAAPDRRQYPFAYDRIDGVGVERSNLVDRGGRHRSPDPQGLP